MKVNKNTIKILILSIFFMIVAVITMHIVSSKQYEKQLKIINEKMSSIVDKVEEKYTNISEEEILEILNSQEETNKILSKYGYTEDIAYINKLEKNRKENLIVNIFLIIVFGAVIVAILLYDNKKKEEEIRDIDKYLKKINNGEYQLKIENNKDDELSRLRNELYKTTILLRETAENSKKEKANLSNSLADISHQLKTPLTSIRIMLDNIQENPDMDEATKNEFMEDISKQIDWISSLVIALLKLAKFDAGSIKMKDEDINVGELIEDTLSSLAVLIDVKDIKVEKDLQQNVIIKADYNWQKEALINIIKNSIEHSKDGGKLIIKTQNNSLFAKIIVIDEGEGIAPKDINHIFERFYKSKNSSENSIGIGLSLAKTIIEKENGYIKVDSEVGKGTKFEIKYLK